MATDTLNTIIPYILLIIAVVWIWATFGEPFKRFYEWVRDMFSSRRERFQPPNPANVVREFTYS